MKARKTLFAIGASTIASIALLIGVASAVENKPTIFNGYADASHSFVLTSSDFTAASGDIEKCGVSFHYVNASVSDGIVSIASGRIYNNMNHHSGSSKSAGGMRGNGFTRVVFSDFSKVLDGADGTVVYTKAGSTDEAKATVSFTDDIDLTISGTVDAKDRTRVHFEGANDTFRFSSITFYYECTVVTPSVSIEGSSNSFGVGETAELTAVPKELFDDVATYSWISSNTGVATVTTGSTDVTVTGVAAGEATITCTMTVGGNNYSDTYVVTVTEAPSVVKRLEVLSETKWEGTGFFAYINPSSVGISYSTISTLPVSFSTNSSVIGNGNKVGFQIATTDTKACYYMNGFTLPSGSEKFTMSYTFTDSSVSPNIKYVADIYIDGTTVLLGAGISGDDSVDVNESIDLTATYSLSGEVTSYSWEVLDSFAEVTNSSSSVATLTAGDDAGYTRVKLDIGVGKKHYIATKLIEVVDAGASYYDIPLNTSKTRALGDQIWIYFNPSTMGLTNSNKGELTFSAFNNVVITKTGNSPDAANNYVTGGPNEVTLKSGNDRYAWGYVNEGEALLYVRLSTGLDNGWNLQYVFTFEFEFNSKTYKNVITLVGGVFVSAE